MRVGRIGLLSAIAVCLASAATLVFTGSVVLFDPHQKLASAHLVDGWGHRQELAYIGIAYVGVPRLEGPIAIKCNNGKTGRFGYVTPGVSVWQSMSTGNNC
jgi:hypothetical protein